MNTGVSSYQFDSNADFPQSVSRLNPIGLAQIAGMARRRAAGLRPYRQAMWFIADLGFGTGGMPGTVTMALGAGAHRSATDHGHGSHGES